MEKLYYDNLLSYFKGLLKIPVLCLDIPGIISEASVVQARWEWVEWAFSDLCDFVVGLFFPEERHSHFLVISKPVQCPRLVTLFGRNGSVAVMLLVLSLKCHSVDPRRGLLCLLWLQSGLSFLGNAAVKFLNDQGCDKNNSGDRYFEKSSVHLQLKKWHLLKCTSWVYMSVRDLRAPMFLSKKKKTLLLFSFGDYSDWCEPYNFTVKFATSKNSS